MKEGSLLGVDLVVGYCRILWDVECWKEEEVGGWTWLQDIVGPGCKISNHPFVQWIVKQGLLNILI